MANAVHITKPGLGAGYSMCNSHAPSGMNQLPFDEWKKLEPQLQCVRCRKHKHVQRWIQKDQPK